MDKGWWAGAVAESPPSPLHPALLLNAYQWWVSFACILLVGIYVQFSVWTAETGSESLLSREAARKKPLGMVLFVDPSGICKFYDARRTHNTSPTCDLCNAYDIQDEQNVPFHCTHPHVVSLQKGLCVPVSYRRFQQCVCFFELE